MEDRLILLIAISIIVTTIIIILGCIYLLFAHCSNDPQRFKYLPCGKRYKRCCGISTTKRALVQNPFEHDPLREYTINIDDINDIEYDDGWRNRYNFL